MSNTSGRFCAAGVQAIENDINEEVQHPNGWYKIEKLSDDTWVNTGWAPDEKAFRQHAAAVGGTVRLVHDSGIVLFSVTEYVPPEAKLIDSNLELCHTTCPEHS